MLPILAFLFPPITVNPHTLPFQLVHVELKLLWLLLPEERSLEPEVEWIYKWPGRGGWEEEVVKIQCMMLVIWSMERVSRTWIKWNYSDIVLAWKVVKGWSMRLAEGNVLIRYDEMHRPVWFCWPWYIFVNFYSSIPR